MNAKYINWLLDRIRFNKKGYDILIEYMFLTPFKCVIDRDENRINDAYSLLSEYNGNVNSKCLSVLEVLAALAIRIDDEYIGDPIEPNPSFIFWKMCCNLGLNKLDDKHFDERKYYNIINKWMNRDFLSNGVGGIFPLEHPSIDQRDIEIWAQMQEYLSENYI